MSLLDQITSGVDELIGSPAKGTQTSTTKTSVMNIVLQMMEDGKLGFNSLINKFHSNGMGSQASSWVNSGPNDKISPTQLDEALGREQVESIASQAGLPVDETSHELAKVLPTMIDKFTPNGEIPEPGIIQQAASLVRTKLTS